MSVGKEELRRASKQNLVAFHVGTDYLSGIRCRLKEIIKFSLLFSRLLIRWYHLYRRNNEEAVLSISRIYLKVSTRKLSGRERDVLQTLEAHRPAVRVQG